MRRGRCGFSRGAGGGEERPEALRRRGARLELQERLPEAPRSASTGKAKPQQTYTEGQARKTLKAWTQDTN